MKVYDSVISWILDTFPFYLFMDNYKAMVLLIVLLISSAEMGILTLPMHDAFLFDFMKVVSLDLSSVYGFVLL